jgi:hypothetical protein
MRDKIRKRVRAKNIQKARVKQEEADLIRFHENLAEQARRERAEKARDRRK